MEFMKNALIITTAIASILPIQNCPAAEESQKTDDSFSKYIKSPTPQNPKPTDWWIDIKTRQDYFSYIKKRQDWLEYRQGRYYVIGMPPTRFALEGESEAIQRILELDYGATVPFNKAKAGQLYTDPLRRAEKGIYEEGMTCEAITPPFLATAITAATSVAAPEYSVKEYNEKITIPSTQDFIRRTLTTIKTYCKDTKDDAFFNHLIEFLDDYSKVISTIANERRKLDKEAQNKEKARLAEENKKAEHNTRIEEEKRIAQFRATQNAEMERQKKELAIRQAENEAHKKQQQEARIAFNERADKLRNGKEKITNFEDAKIAYQAIDAFNVIAFPPVQPNRRSYSMVGKLTQKEGDNYTFEVTTYNDILYFIVTTTPLTLTQNGLSISFGKRYAIVGTLVGTTKYLTIAGVQRHAAVFVAKFIGE